MLLEHLNGKLKAIEAQGLTRFLRQAESRTAPRQTVRGADGIARELLMFCSNDYLGLAAHPRLAEALIEGVRLYGGGSGASPLISGHTLAHQQLAATLAAWFAPHIPQARALGFCTGYMANLAVVAALGGEDAETFSDSQTGAQRRESLLCLQTRLRAGVAALLSRHPRLGWKLAASATPVQPLIVGGNAEVMQLAARLEREGLRVPGIRPPTVPKGEARLRVTLCATHSAADVDRLLVALGAAAADMDRAAA